MKSFVNGDFESGNAVGWTIGGGNRGGLQKSAINPKDFLPGGSHYASNIAQGHSGIVTTTNNHILAHLMPSPVRNGDYAWRVEDTTTGGYVSVISQQINEYYCMDIYFAWLAVLENGGHPEEESSVMIVELKDTTTMETLLFRRYDARPGSEGVDARFRQSGAYFYTPLWQIEHLPVSNGRLGHNFTLTVLAADCSPTGHRGYIFLDSFGGLAP
jgi:hypothetical protein